MDDLQTFRRDLARSYFIGRAKHAAENWRSGLLPPAYYLEQLTEAVAELERAEALAAVPRTLTDALERIDEMSTVKDVDPTDMGNVAYEALASVGLKPVTHPQGVAA